MQLFLGQIESSPEAVKLSVLQAIFDMLMVHENDFLGKDGGDNVRLWSPLSCSTPDLFSIASGRKDHGVFGWSHSFRGITQSTSAPLHGHLQTSALRHDYRCHGTSWYVYVS